MRSVIIVFFLLSFVSNLNAQRSWKLTYQNDESGNTLFGDMSTLVAAVRDGKSLRVGWKSQSPSDPKRKVEHVADAKFLTILSDNIVFAQIDPIIGQTPDFVSQEIILKENLTWVLIAGSNGKSDSIMRNTITGEIVGHNQRNRSFDWYVLE